MHCYRNLADVVKKVFIFRLSYITILFIINIFNIIVLAAFDHTWILISIVVCNFLIILNSLWHIWSMLYYNRIWEDDDLNHCFFSGVFDFVPAAAIYGSFIGYFTEISNKTPIHWYELTIVIIYLIPLAILILWIIGAIIISIIMCIVNTVHVVDNRNKFYEPHKIVKTTMEHEINQEDKKLKIEENDDIKIVLDD